MKCLLALFLLMPTISLAMDWLGFDKDVSVVRKALGEFSELTAKVAGKQREIDEFGPLPNFN